MFGATTLPMFLIISAMAPSLVQTQMPSAEEAEADPNYKPVESRTLIGKCSEMLPLAQILRSNDKVKKIEPVSCNQLIFTPPSKETPTSNNSESLMAFVDGKKNGGAFLKGIWSDGDFNISELSFDQIDWFPVSKGRVRIYKNDDTNNVLFVVFAVFEDEKVKGVAFNFEG